jgi:hypothetical protein
MPAGQRIRQAAVALQQIPRTMPTGERIRTGTTGTFAATPEQVARR